MFVARADIRADAIGDALKETRKEIRRNGQRRIEPSRIGEVTSAHQQRGRWRPTERCAARPVASRRTPASVSPPTKTPRIRVAALGHAGRFDGALLSRYLDLSSSTIVLVGPKGVATKALADNWPAGAQFVDAEGKPVAGSGVEKAPDDKGAAQNEQRKNDRGASRARRPGDVKPVSFGLARGRGSCGAIAAFAVPQRPDGNEDARTATVAL